MEIHPNLRKKAPGDFRTKPRIMPIFGVRPEAIKMAPVVKALAADPGLETIVTVTAQHREMLDQVLEHFAITPRYDLNIMRPQQTLTGITTAVLEGLEGVLAEVKPDLCLVHGDTTTSMAASLAAFYQQIPIGHVEAGLRTHHKWLPYPEEMNRRLTGALADLHFAPTQQAMDNLVREGVAPDQIFVTGNTAIDALLWTISPNYRFQDSRIPSILARGRTVVAEAHRRENWGEPLHRILLALRELVRAHADVQLIFSVHANPVVAGPVREILGGEDRIHLFDPIPYPDYANLMGRSYLILTDSGGLQEEAPSLGIPVLVFREETERPEALAAGTVRLVGSDPERIVTEADRLLRDPAAYQAMATARNPYGDGHAAERIHREVRSFLGMGSGKAPGTE